MRRAKATQISTCERNIGQNSIAEAGHKGIIARRVSFNLVFTTGLQGNRFNNNVLSLKPAAKMACKVGARGKRKKIASSSDDERNLSGIPNEDDEDDKPLFRSPEKAQVAKVVRSQVKETIIGGWRLVRLDGQYVRVKMTREEKFLIRGERVPETSDSQDEDSEHEPDYLLSDVERSYIDSMADDFMENLPIMLLRPVSLAAELARGAVGALGERKIKFSSYSDME